MNFEEKIIAKTQSFVKGKLEGVESGHDWWHIYRVWKTSVLISKTEDVNMFVVQLAALLHDIADSKFNNGDETIGPRVAKEFLFSIDLDGEIVNHVVNIIENVSFKGGLMQLVQ